MNADNAVTQTGDDTPARPPRPAQPPADYEFFYRSQYRTMMVIAMHANATSHEADELTADTLRQMYDTWPTLSDPFAWARRALINNLMDLRREQRRRLIRQGRWVADTYQRPAEPGCLDDPATRSELLAVLTDTQRRVVELLLADRTPEEIGLILGTTPATVRRNLSNIRRRLRPYARGRIAPPAAPAAGREEAR
ncbi:sigma-70 family RNA polymerase sigma factor [Paractinoplanes globisporus]|uniref:Sigma-70 family RNA polymerase sigma factor n=1 Tax=Paractinoplanes globisporus TaxID=113565 RepID=A0ABW6WJJ1_9ACTN|nr:sigma-70 family RNA polymerase sigma factor [Actinoplanes globisporus]